MTASNALLVALALAAQEAEAAPPLLITNVTVIDCVSEELRPGLNVQIRDGRIESVGTEISPVAGEGYRTVDGSGRFLIPGLWDAHTHVSKARASSLSLLLAHGITSVRDCGGDVEELLRWRTEVEAGERAGPRLFIAGPYLENADRVDRAILSGNVEPYARTRWPVADADAGREAVRRAARLGVDFIKVRTVPSAEAYNAIGWTAEELGLPFAAHVEGVSLDVVAEAGLDSIEHSLLFAEEGEIERAELIRIAVDSGTVMCPTLVNWRNMLRVPAKRLRELFESPTDEHAELHERLSAYLIADWAEQLEEQFWDGRDEWAAELYPTYLQDLKELHAAGMRFLAGSDLAVLRIYPGVALHEELALLVSEVGLTPHEALLAATRHPADWLGAADLGRITPGARADLLLLDANPLVDITNTRAISAVIRAGRVLDRTALDALHDGVLEAPDVRVNDWK